MTRSSSVRYQRRGSGWRRAWSVVSLSGRLYAGVLIKFLSWWKYNFDEIPQLRRGGVYLYTCQLRAQRPTEARFFQPRSNHGVRGDAGPYSASCVQGRSTLNSLGVAPWTVILRVGGVVSTRMRCICKVPRSFRIPESTPFRGFPAHCVFQRYPRIATIQFRRRGTPAGSHFTVQHAHSSVKLNPCPGAKRPLLPNTTRDPVRPVVHGLG